jgi:hypothetical protein
MADDIAIANATSRDLLLHDLHARHPGVTPVISAYYFEATRVCLDRHHASPIGFVIERGHVSLHVTARWPLTDARTRGAWGNHIDTTETGAYCVALAAMETSDGLVAIRRAEQLTGADYYVARASESADDLEQHRRLEVSGVDRGGIAVLRARLRKKLVQIARGLSNLPAIACIVGFRARIIIAQDVKPNDLARLPPAE